MRDASYSSSDVLSFFCLGIVLFAIGACDDDSVVSGDVGNTGTDASLDGSDAGNDANSFSEVEAMALDQLADILRTGDGPDCQRNGEGYPLEECPDGCMPVINPSLALDVQRHCRFPDDMLGGPPTCIPEREPGDCITDYQCWLHSDSQRVMLMSADICDHDVQLPDGWERNCLDFPMGSGETYFPTRYCDELDD